MTDIDSTHPSIARSHGRTTTRTALGAAVVSLLALLSACSGAAPANGCSSDNDCKGSRVCSQGSCVDPGTGGGGGGGGSNSTNADCPSECASKAQSCGATSSQAQSYCGQICSLDLSASQIQCLQQSSCSELQNGDPCGLSGSGGSSGSNTNTGGGSGGTTSGSGGTTSSSGGTSGGSGGSTCGGSVCDPITCHCHDGSTVGPLSYCFNDVCQDTSSGCPDLCSSAGGWP